MYLDELVLQAQLADRERSIATLTGHGTVTSLVRHREVTAIARRAASCAQEPLTTPAPLSGVAPAAGRVLARSRGHRGLSPKGEAHVFTDRTTRFAGRDGGARVEGSSESPNRSYDDAGVLQWERWLAEIEDDGFFGAREDQDTRRQPATPTPPGRTLAPVDFPLWPEEWLVHSHALSFYLTDDDQPADDDTESRRTCRCEDAGTSRSARVSVLELFPFLLIALAPVVIVLIALLW